MPQTQFLSAAFYRLQRNPQSKGWRMPDRLAWQILSIYNEFMYKLRMRAWGLSGLGLSWIWFSPLAKFDSTWSDAMQCLSNSTSIPFNTTKFNWNSTQLNSTQLNSTHPSSAQLNSTQLNSTQLLPRSSMQSAAQFNPVQFDSSERCGVN